MSTAMNRRRFSLAEYYCMGEAGIIGPDERTELIHGEVWVMPPIGPGHAAGGSRVERSFLRRFGDRATVRGHYPIQLLDASEPQPDVVLARPEPNDYRHGHPRPEDIFLIVEICDTTPKDDREVKLPLYAQAGIPET